MAKRCKTCKKTFTPMNSLQPTCSPVCAIAFTKTKQGKAHVVKAKKKERAEQKRDFYANDLKTRKDAAKTACHKYIKARDMGQACICCGRPLGNNYDSGHFLESGNNPIIRYHEDNIHSQSVYCNQFRGGDSDDYEGRLRHKIGDARVDWLLANTGGPVKRTAQDYKQIEDGYKAKLKELECGSHTHNP